MADATSPDATSPDATSPDATSPDATSHSAGRADAKRAMAGGVVVVGIFAADAAYRLDRLPRMGETVLAHAFALGPGGKGSNQAVAAARLGAPTRFVGRLGDDLFADLAERTWAEAGVRSLAPRVPGEATGSAGILIDHATGDNAIAVAPGAAASLDADAVESVRDAIGEASVLLTQLEAPMAATRRGLEIARDAATASILNPAPAAALSDDLLALCDWMTPNESEAAALASMEVVDAASAERAARALMERGAGRGGGIVVTLGEAGALLVTQAGTEHVPARSVGRVVETTGAGDAFNGGFAVALAEGASPAEAVRFGCAVAGLSVTRPGAAASMPARGEVEALLRG